MVSRIYLIRHGITEGNQKMWFYGAADIPLADEGKTKLKELVNRGIYPKIPGDADCYTSGLLRTEQTFAILFGERPHKVLPNLKEMKFGEYECLTYSEIETKDSHESWAMDETGEIAPPGGESRNQFAKRVSSGLEELMGLHRLKEWSHRHGGQDAISVVVCHGGVISAIMQKLFPEVKGNLWDWIPSPGLGYMIEMKEGEPIMYENISDIKKLGFGLMRLPMKGENVDIEQTKEMVDEFMKRGYTYFDTAYGYLDGKSEEAAKLALVDRYPRDKFQLATKLPAWCAGNESEAKAMFDTSLKRTGAGYFDFFLLHNLGADRTASFDEFHIWDFLKQKKEEGLIVNLGFSFHDKASELEKVLIAHPDVDFVQLQINYADWESDYVESRKCYEVATKYNKPIIIMEPIRGGLLANPPGKAGEMLKAYAPEQSGSSWGLRFAASLSGVITILSGMSTLDQMKENLDTMDDFRPLTEEEKGLLGVVAKEIAELPQVPCTMCRYCVKDCPQGIIIPGIFRGMNTASVYGNMDSAKGAYEWETRAGGTASKCIECGQCEEVCPQHIDIIHQLKKAKALFD